MSDRTQHEDHGYEQDTPPSHDGHGGVADPTRVIRMDEKPPRHLLPTRDLRFAARRIARWVPPALFVLLVLVRFVPARFDALSGPEHRAGSTRQAQRPAMTEGAPPKARHQPQPRRPREAIPRHRSVMRGSKPPVSVPSYSPPSVGGPGPPVEAPVTKMSAGEPQAPSAREFGIEK